MAITEAAPRTVTSDDRTKRRTDPDHIKVFANADAAEAWFAENDPEGVAFEYWILG